MSNSATPGTVDHQGPLTKGFSRQEYWSGLPCPPPGDLPNAEIEPASLMSPALAGEFFTTSTTWEAPSEVYRIPNSLLKLCFISLMDNCSISLYYFSLTYLNFILSFFELINIVFFHYNALAINIITKCT